MTQAAHGRTRNARFSLSTQIAIAVGAGVAAGLLVGERAAALQIVADAYINLLQMTVLPYVTVSIIGGLGGLDPREARALGKRAGIVLVLLWGVGLTAVLLFPLMFPTNQSAAFFSTTLLQEREPFDFLNLYIANNPFHALANNIVPAVVLFSLVVGVALIGVPDKAPLLQMLAAAGRAVSRATNFIVSLTPIGVFAIAAVVAGTLSLEELQRIEVYLISYCGVSLLLALWVLPGLVAALTPVPYRELLSRNRNALVMAFMTTSLFAVLPLITEEAKALVRQYAGGDERHEAATDVIVPASFNFPHTGKLLSISFVVFAAWFSDAYLPISGYAQLVGTGLFVMFGNVNAAIPFLLDLLRVPADTFRLFVTSSVVNARFGTLVAAVHTLTIAVLGTCVMTRTLTIDARKIFRFVIITVMLTVAVVGGTRVLLEVRFHQAYTKDTVLASMRMRRDRGTGTVFDERHPAPPLPAVSISVLDRVRSRSALRVGYFEDSLPYAFVNLHGELVGFDMEMALQLARDLGVSAEFVPLPRTVLDAGLDSATCDLVMSGVVMTADRALHVQFSAPYLDETVAFIVPDHMASTFSSWESVRAMGRLRIAVPRGAYFMQKIRNELADVDIVPLDRLDDAFRKGHPPFDAITSTAERGSAYTLLHPEYSVAVPKPRPFKVPLAYVPAGRDAAMTALINSWIELKRKDGTLDELFAHWILGQDSSPKQPRWSVLDDVFRKRDGVMFRAGS
jgi:Na+/H+-dicarboxylate symporter/ABC-type amino acid transport substrate-binding protein